MKEVYDNCMSGGLVKFRQSTYPGANTNTVND